MRYWAWLSSLLFLSTVQAASLPDFRADYDVHALGMTLGTSAQHFRCQTDGRCTLTARTAPQGLARLFTNEHFFEQSHLLQQDNTLVWQRYHKEKYDGKRLIKTVTLVRQADGSVVYEEKQRTYPAHPHLFDILSLPLYLGWLHLNAHALPEDLYLQDNNWQDRIRWLEQQVADTVVLAETDREVSALRYTGDLPHARVTLWLLPDFHYLPGRVEVYNKEKQKTIVLQLRKEPRIP